MSRRIQLPKPPGRSRDALDRLGPIVRSPWWHPAVYLLLTALIVVGDVTGQWWLIFTAVLVTVFSAVGWGFYTWAAPIIEQDRQRAAARADVAAAAADLASVTRDVAAGLRAVADACTIVQTAMSATHPSSSTTDKPDA